MTTIPSGKVAVVSNNGVILVPSQGIKSWLGEVKNKFAYAKDVVVHDKDWAKRMEVARKDAAETKRQQELTSEIEKTYGTGTKNVSASPPQVIPESKSSESSQRKPQDKDVIDASYSMDEEQETSGEETTALANVPDNSTALSRRPAIELSQHVRKSVSNILSDIGERQRRISNEEVKKITTELVGLQDAGTIISNAENKERVVMYSAELKRMIDLLRAERRIKHDEFENEEDEIYNKMKNDVRLAKNQAYEKIDSIKASMLPQSQKEHKITTLQNDVRSIEREMQSTYNGVRERNQADMVFIDTLIDNLDKIHRQVDRQFQVSVR